VPLDKWIRGALVIGSASCVGGDGTKHRARCFPERLKSGLLIVADLSGSLSAIGVS
jgi:hypothetical protein